MHFKIPLLLVPSLVLAIPFPLFDSTAFPLVVEGTTPIDNSTWIGVGEDPAVDGDGVFTDAMRSLRGDKMFDFVGKNVGINLEMIMGEQEDDEDRSVEKRQAQVLKQRPAAQDEEYNPVRNPKFRPIPTRSIVVTPSSTIVVPTTTRSTVSLSISTTAITPPPAISTPPAPAPPTTTSVSVVVPTSTRITSTPVLPTLTPSSSVVVSSTRSVTSSAAPAIPSPLTNLGFTRSGFNLDIRHVGQGTFFAVGLGACGTVAQPSDQVVAVSRLLFDTFPGAGPNPNLNPICGQQLLVTYAGTTIRVSVQDRCESCAIWDLDFSTTAFAKLADFDLGRLDNVNWVFV